MDSGKADRVLGIYSKLMFGVYVNKAEETQNYGVNERSIPRDIDAVLDRFPTAKVLDETDGVYTVSAETFSEGIKMWLRSQGEMVEVL